MYEIYIYQNARYNDKKQITLLIQYIQHLTVAKNLPIVYNKSLHVSAFITKPLTSQTTIEVQ